MTAQVPDHSGRLVADGPAQSRARVQHVTGHTEPVIIGVGIDVVPVERFAESLTRTPGLRDRLFTAAEQHTPVGQPAHRESLAARFAAKEALAKALGAPGDLHWHDAEVIVGEHGRPHLEVRGYGRRPGRAARRHLVAHLAQPRRRHRLGRGRRGGLPARGGHVIGLYTAEEVRAAEEPLLAATPEGALMQRAATGLATVCLRLLGARLRPPRRAARRHRQQRRRRPVRRRVPGPPGRPRHRRPARPRTARTRPGWPRCAGPAGGCCRRRRPEVAPAVGRADLVLDGMLGIGGRGGLRPDAAELARAGRRAAPAITVAVDVPSGVDADTGAVDGRGLPGHAHGDLRRGQARAGRGGGPRRTPGEVHLVDIGLGPHLPPPTAFRLTDADVAARLAPPVGRRTTSTRRAWSASSAGSATYPGAGVLCTGAALRTRPGLVRYAGTAADGVRAAWPEAIVTDGRPRDAGRVQAWVVGPGMGTDDDARSVLAEVLGHRPAGDRRRRRADDARRASPALVRGRTRADRS